MPRHLHSAALLIAVATLATTFGCSSEAESPDLTGANTAAASADAAGPSPTLPAAGPPGSLGSVDQLMAGCKSCHGADLAGSATPLAGYPAGVSLLAPNLTPDKETGIGAWTDGQLRVAIRQGLDQEGRILCPQMKHYPTIPNADLEAIIARLRAQPPVKKLVGESVCPPLKR